MPSIRDFSGGVVNQELQNRDNGGGVLFDCKNVLSSWNGELRKRAGTYWLQTLPEYRRIIPYRMPDGNDIMLLIGDGTMYGYQFTGDHIVTPVYEYSGDAPEFPTTGWGTNVTNGDYTIYLSSRFAQTTWGKAFDKPSIDNHRYYNKGALFSYRPVPTPKKINIKISSEDPQILKSLCLRWANTCSGDHLDHYKAWIDPIIYYSDDGTNWTAVRTQVSNPIVVGDGDMYKYSHYWVADGQTESIVYYKATNVEHNEAHKHWAVWCNDYIPNHWTYGTERIDMFVENVTYVPSTTAQFVEDNTFFSADLLDNIKYAQNDSLMILTNGKDTPLKIEYAAGTFTVEDFNYTMDAAQGKPNCVAFYQNRLWFGGFTVFPTRVWASGFGNFTDFTIPETILPTSPISADAVQIQSIIENLWGGNDALYCLSEDGVSMIDAQGGIVATDQIEFKLRNREPVDKMTPTIKDDIMIYLGRNQRKILLTDYDFVVQRFKANNISTSYDDFLQSGIRELHYIPNRASLIYGILHDGKWFALLFDQDRQKNALFPFETNGKIIDIQPIKYGSVTKLCLLTQRSGQYMLEEKMSQPDQKIMDFMSKEEKEEYTDYIKNDNEGYLDCTIKKTFEEPVTEIENVPFSSNDIVSVIADGAYLGDIQLTSSISTDLYAWTYDNKTIYTQTETPTTTDGLFTYKQELLPNYEIVSTDDDSITVHQSGTEDVPYYCWENPQQAHSSYTASAAVPGTWTRYPAGDGYSTDVEPNIYYYAWKNGNTIGYHNKYTNRGNRNTLLLLSIGDRLTRYPPTPNPNVVVAKIDAIYPIKIYTKTENPVAGDTVYDSNFQPAGTLTLDNDEFVIVVDGTKYGRKIDDDVIHPEPVDTIDTYTRDSEADIAPENVKLVLPAEASNVIFGYKYDSYAVLKFISPYNLQKFPVEISVNFINSGYLEVGNTFDSLKSVLNNLVETVTIDNKQILMNGNYTKTLDKQTFETPYVIVRSDKGLPFIITGIDYKVDTSNYQGGV